MCVCVCTVRGGLRKYGGVWGEPHIALHKYVSRVPNKTFSLFTDWKIGAELKGATGVLQRPDLKQFGPAK